MFDKNTMRSLEVTWRMINKTINRPSKAAPHWIFIKGYDSASDKAYAELYGYKWELTPDRWVCSQCGKAANDASAKFCPHCNVEMVGKPEVLSETIDVIHEEAIKEMEMKK